MVHVDDIFLHCNQHKTIEIERNIGHVSVNGEMKSHSTQRTHQLFKSKIYFSKRLPTKIWRNFIVMQCSKMKCKINMKYIYGTSAGIHFLII